MAMPITRKWSVPLGTNPGVNRSKSTLLYQRNGIEQGAVFTPCDLERVRARREGEFHHTVAIVTTLNLVPVPGVTIRDVVEAYPTASMVVGVGHHARDPEPEGVAATGDDYTNAKSVYAVLGDVEAIRRNPVGGRITIFIANAVYRTNMLTCGGSGTIREPPPTPMPPASNP